MDTAERSNLVVASLWMVGITLALFFLPLVNGVIGGLVGGYKARRIPQALLAAILPAAVATVGLWIIVSALGAPVIGALAGTAVGILIALADLGIFAGAAIGGWLAQSRGQAHGHA